MKKVLLLLIGLIATTTVAQAQLKVAYTNADSILMALPDTKLQQEQLQNYGNKLQTQLVNQQKELEDKATKLEGEKNDLPQIVLQERVKELRQLEENLNKFQQSAQQDLQRMEQQLLGPVFEKIQTGIDAVAKANGYAFVLPENMLLYADPQHDITQKVIAHLTK